MAKPSREFFCLRCYHRCRLPPRLYRTACDAVALSHYCCFARFFLSFVVARSTFRPSACSSLNLSSEGHTPLGRCCCCRRLLRGLSGRSYPRIHLVSLNSYRSSLEIRRCFPACCDISLNFRYSTFLSTVTFSIYLLFVFPKCIVRLR